MTADDDRSGERATSADSDDVWARQTAPQSPYTIRQVGIGILVLAIGLVLSFGVALVLG